MHIVIVGNGIAGMEAALAVREREADWEITLVSEESDHLFSRTALMYVASGQLKAEDIEPLERDVYERLRFQRVRARAVGVDVQAHELRLAGDLAPLSYDRLLIACGSRPRPGPWVGSDLPGVGHFVTMQDLEWLEDELHGGPSRGGPAPNARAHEAASEAGSPYLRRSAARAGRGHAPTKPAVIGGGLIGIEAVEVMHAAGLHPRFYIREEYFWPMAIDGPESAWICERMREHGVHVHLEENVEALIAAKDGTLGQVRTDKGTEDVDLCVVAIGVVPNTDWLGESSVEGDGPHRTSGATIERDRRGAIVVGPDLSTSAEDVYAAGDCAAVRWFDGSQRPEQLWYTSRDQGRVAARSLLGDRAKYERGRWYNSAKLFDIEYTTAGFVNMKIEGEENWFFEERGDVRSTSRVVLRHGEVIGFNMLGRRWDHEVLLRFIEERRSLSYVLDHLAEAAFDTEFVPPLVVPAAARSAALGGPADNPYVPGPTAYPEG